MKYTHKQVGGRKGPGEAFPPPPLQSAWYSKQLAVAAINGSFSSLVGEASILCQPSIRLWTFLRHMHTPCEAKQRGRRIAAVTREPQPTASPSRHVEAGTLTALDKQEGSSLIKSLRSSCDIRSGHVRKSRTGSSGGGGCLWLCLVVHTLHNRMSIR